MFQGLDPSTENGEIFFHPNTGHDLRVMSK